MIEQTLQNAGTSLARVVERRNSRPLDQAQVWDRGAPPETHPFGE